jgi:hypothetical protein
MARKNTEQTKPRLLLNAEAFGFGPTAAIADCFPFLRKHFSTIGFAGTGHTLDLQRPLAYDAIHDVSQLEETALNEIFAQYDIFLTALDFAMAEKALGQGLTVCIYDPLTWYWKTIPAVVRDVDLYIAQNFFGVEERLKSAEFAAANCQTVAPIVGQQPDNQSNGKADSTKDLVLVNLGGLSNPLWTGNEALTYARQILEAVLPTLAGQKVVVAANSAISAALAHLGAKNLSREQMQVVLQQAKYALMTPGLGNIYDAARFDTPTIWLPPANDSQGQQLALLNQSSLVDGLVDWHQILPVSAIDYSADQGAVLKSIAAALEQGQSSKRAKTRLAKLLRQQIKALPQNSRLTALVERFGSGGAQHVAELVYQQSCAPTNTQTSHPVSRKEVQNV